MKRSGAAPPKASVLSPRGCFPDWIRRLPGLILTNSLFTALVAFICIVALFQPSLLRWPSLEAVIRQTADVAVVAFPMALLVISGSVDLSVGSASGLCGIVMAGVASVLGFPLGVLAGLSLGLVLGALNGLLVSYLGLHPVVVTLGGLSLWRGAALLFTGARTIGMGTVPDAVLDYGIGLRHLLFLPLHFYLLLAAYLLTWGAAHKSVFGERLFAVGGNERAAFLAGIDVQRTRFIAHILTGLGAAMAGLLLFIRSGAAHGSDGGGLEFSALTIVLLGGVSFQGGMGRVRGVLAALFFMTFLRHGLVLLKTPLYLQHMSSGILIILALYVDSLLTRRAEKKG